MLTILVTCKAESAFAHFVNEGGNAEQRLRQRN